MKGIWFLFWLYVARDLWTKLRDPDLWWHLAAGREMVLHRHFLRTDIFSHTLTGQPWINFEWLSEIFIYLFWRVGGVSALFAGKIILSLLCLAGLMMILRQSGARDFVLPGLAGLGFFLLRPRLLERPELFSLISLPLFIFLIQWARNHAAARTPAQWILFSWMVVWANMHGGFIYGLGLLVLMFAGSLWSDQDAKFNRFLIRTGILSFAAALINPYGFGIFKVHLEHLTQLRQGGALIQEWMPGQIQDLPLFWILFVVVHLILVVGILKKWEEAKFWAPAVIVFGIWGALHYRNAALFTFVCLPLIARFLNLYSEKISRYALRAKILLGSALLIAVIWRFSTPFPDSLVAWKEFPVRACEFIQAKDVRGTLFNTYGQGGYVSWALGPDRKVMMDGRYLFHSLIQQMSESFQNGRFPQFLDYYGVDVAITDYVDAVPFKQNRSFPITGTNMMFPRTDWGLVFWDDAAMVFLKRTPAFQDFIREHEYRFLTPENLDEMRFHLRTSPNRIASVQEELDRHERENSFSVIAGIMQQMIRMESSSSGGSGKT